jgi:hypothetical protein
MSKSYLMIAANVNGGMVDGLMVVGDGNCERVSWLLFSILITCACRSDAPSVFDYSPISVATLCKIDKR